MKLPIKHTLALAFALSLASPVTAFATNGMWMIGAGAKSTAMGGVGVAYPQDAMAAASNPASITDVGTTRLDATIELFYPPRAVRHESGLLGTTDVASKDNLFPIPAIGAVMSDPSVPLSMGMAIIGAGLGTNYRQNSDPTNCVPNFYNPCITNLPYERVGVFLMQMQMLPTFAYRVNENHSVGASIVIAAQTFRAFGLEAFSDLGFTNDTSSLTNKGYDWGFGWGYRLGWFGKFLNQKLNLGLTYAPRVEMQKFNRYTGLFANHGEFDIPPSAGLGIAYKFTPKFAVAMDVQRIYWSKVESIGNAGPNVNSSSDFNPNGVCGISASNPTGDDGISPECTLGGDLGMGFGWENQTVYKLGFDYKYGKDLTLRAGYNYAKSPIPPDQVLFNMLAPATSERHVTFGFTKDIDKDSDFTFTFMHAFEETIKGPTVFPASGTTGNNAAITMQQTSLSFAYGLKF
jgi:long-chain fatty acid transport protein